MRTFTSGDIARFLGLKLHAVTDIIRLRGIKDVGREGHTRLFDEQATGQIIRELFLLHPQEVLAAEGYRKEAEAQLVAAEEALRPGFAHVKELPALREKIADLETQIAGLQQQLGRLRALRESYERSGKLWEDAAERLTKWRHLTMEFNRPDGPTSKQEGED